MDKKPTDDRAVQYNLSRMLPIKSSKLAVGTICVGLVIIQVIIYWNYHIAKPKDSSMNNFNKLRQNTTIRKSILKLYRATSLNYGLVDDSNFFEEWQGYQAHLCYNGYRCQFSKTPEESQALLFHPSFIHRANLKSLLKNRSPKQRWIFFSWESPINGYIGPNSSWRYQFNWTATYMHSSDIWIPYSLGYKKRDKILNTSEVLFGPDIRQSLVFATISNCRVKFRNRLVKELQKYVTVDVYGRCGTKLYPSGSGNVMKLSKNYKFYLAIENSMCRDYFTEKFWRNSLQSYAVPIVAGGYERSDLEKVAPPNSFIYAKDFKTTRHLADYLNELARDERKYSFYLAWKKKFDVIRISEAVIAICNICKRLHEDSKPSTRDLASEWDSRKLCRPESEQTVFPPR